MASTSPAPAAPSTLERILTILEGFLPIAEVVANLFIKNAQSKAIAGQVEGEINSTLSSVTTTTVK